MIQELFEKNKCKVSDNYVFGALMGRFKNIGIFGFGQNYHAVCRFILERYNFKVNLVLDETVENNDNSGCTFFNFKDDLPAHIDPSEYLVINSVFNRSARKHIHRKLNDFGFQFISDYEDIFDYHVAYGEVHREDFYFNNLPCIESAFAKFSDRKSRDLFLKILEMYFTRVPAVLPMSPQSRQYYPEDVPLTGKMELYVNCGAFRGENLVYLAQLGIFYDKNILIEPNSDNLLFIDNRVEEVIRDFNLKKLEVEVIKAALGASPDEIFLKKKLGSNAHAISSNCSQAHGDIDESLEAVRVVRLDDISYPSAVSHLQMDIEGYELEALRGAQKLITTSAPDLSISAYHRPEDLWNIVNFLETMRPDYKFYLRNYSSTAAETILHAVRD